MIARRLRVAVSEAMILVLSTPWSAIAQTLTPISPPSEDPPSAPAPSSAAVPSRPLPTDPSVPTRAIAFYPDRPEVQLQFHGVDLIRGIWREGWLPACNGPCTGSVPVAQRYRVAGPDVHASSDFAIAPGTTPLRLDANTGSASGFTLGTVAAIGGGAVLGSALLFAIANGGCRPSDPPQLCDRHDGEQTTLLVVAGAGAVALIIGFFQMKANRTTVAVVEQPTP